MKHNQKEKNSVYIMIFSIVGLLAIFVLFAFARSVIDETLESVQNDYETSLQKNTAQFNEQYASIPPIEGSDPLRRGSPINQPSVTIIEYGDFQCPFCAAVAETLQQVLARYPRVELAWKDLPNPIHTQAFPAAHAARCAHEQGVFWEYHDALFANQDKLGDVVYNDIAVRIGLNITQFGACMENLTYAPLIDENIASATRYRVDGTPYLFVGSTRVDYAASFEELSRIIERELASQ